MHARRLQRQPATASKTATPATPRAAASASRAQALQRQLGAQGASALVARRQAASRDAKAAPPSSAGALIVSSPADASEREAVAVAARVMRMPASASTSAPVATHHAVANDAVSRDAAPASANANIATADAIHSEMAHGAPLPPAVRAFMEPRFGARFDHVRIHTDERAASLSADLHATAFTVGEHIFFGHGAYRPDDHAGRELIAHELTHTLQQGPANAPVQRAKADGSAASEGESFTEGLAWGVAERVAPSVVPMMRKGPAGVMAWLRDTASSAASAMFGAVTAPLHAISGVGKGLAAQFAPVIASVQTAVAQLGRNDATPLRDAAARIEALAGSIVTPVVATLQPVVATIKGALRTVSDVLGAPIWDWIKRYASWHWSVLKTIAHEAQALVDGIDDSPVAKQVWTWFRNKIGFGDGPEGHDGLLQWVQRKLSEAWTLVSAGLAPFKKQIVTAAATVGAVLLALSPAGPVIAVGAAIAGAAVGLRWIVANWGKGNMIVQARHYLHGTLIPALLGAMHGVEGAVARVAQTLRNVLAGLANLLTRATGALGEGLAGLAPAALQHIEREVIAISAWANAQLQALSHGVQAAGARLRAVLNTVTNMLGKVSALALNIWLLPAMLAEKAWSMLPAGIRDPIVDFVIPLMLRHIALFQELMRDKEAWQQTKADVMRIIHLVFRNHDLQGALKATFHLILRLFNLPPELLVSVRNKALAAWDIVSEKPLTFLRNAVRTIGVGFRLMAGNFLFHLKYGLETWLLGPLRENGITPPSSWTDPKAVFYFVLDVLGVPVDHAFELLKRKGLDAAKVDKVRAIYGRVATLADWIGKSIDTSKSPAENARGIIAQAAGFGVGIMQGIAQWVAMKVAEELAMLAAAAAASGGLSEVVDIVRRIYKALQTAARWARPIVEMMSATLDNVQDIASGAIEKAGARLEQILHRGMPIVIAFLADQVGLGDIGKALKNVLDALREKVDQALLWLIDKIKAGLDALAGLVKVGVAKVADWWRMRFGFRAKDGSHHEVFFEGGPQNVALMIASRPKRLRSYLGELVKTSPSPLAGTAFDFLLEHVEPHIKKLEKITGNTAADHDRRRDVYLEDLAPAITELNRLLAELMSESGDDFELPDDPGWYSNAGSGAKASGFKRLSYRTSKIVSDKPTENPPGWELLQQHRLTDYSGDASDWKRMHMVTAKIGGAGGAANLVPARTGVNSGSAVRNFEEFVQALVQRTRENREQKNAVWIDVQTTGFHPAGPPGAKRALYDGQTFPSGLVMKAGLAVWDKNDWRKTADAIVVEVSIEAPALTDELPDFNTLSLTVMCEKLVVTKPFARDFIIAARNEYGPFRDFDDVVKGIRRIWETKRKISTLPFESTIARLELEARDHAKKPVFRFLR
jgi:hypothetical protein